MLLKYLKVKIERPFGIFLSGGLDSGILAAILKPDFAITCSFKGKFYNELKYAKEIAKHLDIPLKIIRPDGKDFKKVLKEGLKIIGKPINSVSLYPWMKIMEEAKGKRMVGGEGADEIFGGYSRYLILKRIHEMYKMESLKNYHPMLDNVVGLTKIHSKMTNVSCETLLKRYKEQYYFLSKIGWAEYKEYLPPVVSMEKKVADYFNIELILPFMNKKVADYGFSLPDDRKIQGEIRKLEVYKIAQKLLPEMVWKRKGKKGFGSPVNEWCGSKNEYDKTKYLKLQYGIIKQLSKSRRKIKR